MIPGRKFIRILLLHCLLVVIAGLFHCKDDDEGDCSCDDDNAPYSAPGASTCYATEAECEDAEDTSCMICL